MPTGLSDSAKHTLQSQNYSPGLIAALEQNKRAFSEFIWIVDNSGSMQTRDGQKLVPKNNSYVTVPTTRWAEMQQTVEYHAQLSATLQQTTTFRMLNDPGRVAGPQIFSIRADNNSNSMDTDLATALSTIQNTQPGGVTPLTQHLLDISNTLQRMEPQLRADGTKVAVVLATDGVPTDTRGYSNDAVKQEFYTALRTLVGLPVWIVVRLCTDEEQVVEYWNNLDNALELNLEVLDDYMAEAAEVHAENPWLNYGLPLHRMRECGYYNPLLDHIDERKLEVDEVLQFVRVLFGNQDLPDPHVDWKSFSKALERIVSGHTIWNPVTKKVTPWIDVKALNKMYGPKTFFGLF